MEEKTVSQWDYIQARVQALNTIQRLVREPVKEDDNEDNND